MTVSWKFISVGSLVSVTTADITLTEPAGVQQGDLLIACISHRAASTTDYTLPAGWTLVNQATTNNVLTTTSAVASGVMAYIIRGASAPSFAFTKADGANQAIGRVVAYRNSAQSSVLGVNAARQTAIAVTAVSVTGLTTAEAGDLLVAAACGGQEATWTNFNATTPGTSSGTGAAVITDPDAAFWTERSDDSSVAGADGSLGIFDAVKTTAGATGNFTATASLGASHLIIVGAFKILDVSSADIAGYTDAYESMQFSNTASDLTGVGQNKKLVSSGATVGTWSGQVIGAAGNAYGSWFTESGIPGTDGLSEVLGNVHLYIPTANANFQYGAMFVRVNSSGVVQAVSPEKWTDSVGAGFYSFDIPLTGLGTWASGDRLEVRLALHNKSASTAQSCTIQLTSTTDDTAFSGAQFSFANRTLRFAYGDKGIGIGLSGSDLIATRNAIDASKYSTVLTNVRRLVKPSAKKYHCEFTIGTLSGGIESVSIGLVDWSAGYLWYASGAPGGGGYWLGSEAASIGCFNDGVVYNNNADTGVAGKTFQAGDVVALEFDAVNDLVYWNRRRAGVNTGWSTGQATGFTLPVSPAITMYTNGDAVTINLAGPFVIAQRTGFDYTWGDINYATNVWQATASLAGAGALAADTIKQKTADAVFSGTGGIAADTVKSKLGVAAFAGTGGLAADTFKYKTGDALFSGAGSLTAVMISGATTWFATAKFDGVGNLAADTFKFKTATAEFDGAGDLSAVTAKYKTASTLFNGVGGLAATVMMRQGAAAQFNGSGAAVAYLNQVLIATAQFNGSGGMAAAAQKVQVYSTAVFNGEGFLLATPFAAYQARAPPFAGAGSLAAAASQVGAATAKFAGSGDLLAVSTTVAVQQATAQFNGSGGLTAAPTRVFDATTTAVLGGTGGLSANALLVQVAAAKLSGAGDFFGDVDVAGTVNGSAKFVGAGGLLAAPKQISIIAATLAGAGGVSAQVRAVQSCTALYSGSGSFAAVVAPMQRLIGPQVTFDPLRSSVNLVLSNGNRTITTSFSADYATAISTTSKSSGKHAFSVHVPDIFNSPSGDDIGIGFANAAANVETWLGIDGNSVSAFQTGLLKSTVWNAGALTGEEGEPYAVSPSTLDVLFVVDVDARKFWYRVGSGNWNGNPLADPSTGVGGFNLWFSGDVFAGVSIYATDPELTTINFRPTGLPAGVSPWDDSSPAALPPAVLAGAGGLSADTLRFTFATARLDGLGALAANLVVRGFVTARFAGQGGVLAIGLTVGTQQLVATLPGAGNLSATLSQWHRATAYLSGTGSLAALAFQVRPATAALAGTGELTAFAQIKSPTPVTAKLSGGGGLSARLALRQRVTAAFVGAGGFFANAQIRGTVEATARLTGAGNLVAKRPLARLAARATLVGTGHLTAKARQVHIAAAKFAGAGGVRASLFKRAKVITATLSGAGSLNTGTVVARLRTRATLPGAGSLRATPQKYKITSARFTGLGVFTASARVAEKISSRFSGSGTSRAIATMRGVVAAKLSASGGLRATTVKVRPFSTARFAGVGSLVAAPLQRKRISAQFSGSGSFSAYAFIAKTWTLKAKLVGTGGVAASIDLRRPLYVTPFKPAKLRGEGTLTAFALQFSPLKAKATFVGTGSFGAHALQFRPHFATAKFSGSGGLRAAMVRRVSVTARFAGQGGFRAVAAQTLKATFAGSGGLRATIRRIQFMSAKLAGSGTLRSAANRKQVVSTAKFAGRGGVLAQPTMIALLAIKFSGTGHVTAKLGKVVTISAKFAGTGRLTARLGHLKFATAKFNGSGSLRGRIYLPITLSPVHSFAAIRGYQRTPPTITARRRTPPTFTGSL